MRRLGIDFENVRHVLRKVEDDGGVAALSGEGSAASAGEQRSAMVAAQGDGGEYVFLVARYYDSDRNLAIVGAVGGIEGAAALIEADLSAKMAAKRRFKRGNIELRGMGLGWSSSLRHKAQNIFVEAGRGTQGQKSLFVR